MSNRELLTLNTSKKIDEQSNATTTPTTTITSTTENFIITPTSISNDHYNDIHNNDNKVQQNFQN